MFLITLKLHLICIRGNEIVICQLCIQVNYVYEQKLSDFLELKEECCLLSSSSRMLGV